ncbi:DoxX family protein [Vulgatibacter sp.]|uniref:DoxX family protein n=1 Tax=Vulgatibacter sp. TaxID=1971226 RepID=UPI0035668F53
MNGTNAALRNIGWTVLRIVSGVLLMTHGYAKLTRAAADPELQLGRFLETVQGLGFRYPEFFAWLAVAAELGGGFLVAIGFFTRPAAAAAAFTMAVAVYSHRLDGFAAQEKALLFGVIFFVMALGGSGPVSFDDWIRARRAKASSSIFK